LQVQSLSLPPPRPPPTPPPYIHRKKTRKKRGKCFFSRTAWSRAACCAGLTSVC
jgi:hypothetical protein